MNFCVNCGNQISDVHQTFCNICGEAIPERKIEHHETFQEKLSSPNERTIKKKSIKSMSPKKISTIVVVSILAIGLGGGGGMFLAGKFSNKTTVNQEAKKDRVEKEDQEVNSDSEDTKETIISSKEKTPAASSSPKIDNETQTQTQTPNTDSDPKPRLHISR